jgi:signal transduction histidine kinase
MNVRSESVTLEISDRGKGIPPATLTDIVSGGSVRGIGIAIMRERVQLLSGQVDIHSGHGGTTIRAVLPLQVNA